MDAPANGDAGAGPRSPHKLKLKAPAGLAGWAIGEDKFAPGEGIGGRKRGGGVKEPFMKRRVTEMGSVAGGVCT